MDSEGGRAVEDDAGDLSPWYTVYQQSKRLLKAGVFEATVRDLQMLSRETEERASHPRAG